MTTTTTSLPVKWTWKTIRDVTLPILKVLPQDNPNKEFYYLDISSIDNKTHKIVEPKVYIGTEAPSRARQYVLANDILFSTVRTYLENIATVPEKYDGQIASTGFSVLRSTNDVNPKFLFYYCLTNSFLEPLFKLQRGTSYPAVRDSDVRVQPIPVPPIEEQERIVAKIEELFTQLDAGVEALKRVQAGLKRYKASVLKAACEGRLVPQDPSDEQAEEMLRSIGKKPLAGEDLLALPNGWCWMKLRNVCSKIQDGTHFSPKLQFSEPGEDRYLYVTAKNIKEEGVDLSDISYVNKETYNEISKRCDPGRGDVLLIKDGVKTGIATVCELADKSCLLSSVAQLRPNREFIDAYFLKHYLNSPVGHRMIVGEMTGTAIKRIILDKIRESIIPIPPLIEQQRIVAEVEQRLSVANEVEVAVDVGLTCAARLRQAILKRAFEGKLTLD